VSQFYSFYLINDDIVKDIIESTKAKKSDTTVTTIKTDK